MTNPTPREIQLVEAALKAAAAECEQWNATPGSRLAKQIRSLDLAAIVARVPAQEQVEPTDAEIDALWQAQCKYHGGEPTKLAHIEFARALLSSNQGK